MRRKSYRLDRAGLSAIADLLKLEGYRIFGPKLADHAIQWSPLESIDDLPQGWTADTAPASYRVLPRTDQALFGYWTGPDSLKKFLHPPHACVARAEMDNGSLRILHDHPPSAKRAFFGVRACDLAAVAALDRVLLGDRYADDIYSANRTGAFFIAVHCTSSAPTCFCASTKSGPQAKAGFDIALHERLDTGPPVYFAESGSSAGAAILEKSGAAPAPPEWAKELSDATAAAAAAQSRRVNLAAAPAVLEKTFEHPLWDDVAGRCLACANCTSACPTCFCVNFEDHSSLDLKTAERHRLWDSCFTQNFTYIHGGSIRLSPKSRYRQWLSHKLSRWQDQFGMTGCVGCGRCIAWCPAGIDITQEFEALQASPAAPATTGV